MIATDGGETEDLLVPNPNRHYVPESSSEEDDDDDEEEAAHGDEAHGAAP